MKFNDIVKELSVLGASEPRAEAYLVIEKLFGVSRSLALIETERDYSSAELDSLLEKRKRRIPLQYIFGEWGFMGKDFYVSPDCLIPRPDTEILVEKAIEIIKKCRGVYENECSRTAKDSGQKSSENGEKPYNNVYRVADLCTGSGCIALSLLMHSDLESITLMDISSGALDMARKNATRHGLTEKCTFVLGDITKDMPRQRFDLIVSNPPYIPSSHIKGLEEEVKKEPSLALDGGEDGLDIIRFLIDDGLSYLDVNGAMLIEFGFDQGEIMDALLRQKCDTGSIKSYEIVYDYGKNPRVAVIYV